MMIIAHVCLSMWGEIRFLVEARMRSSGGRCMLSEQIGEVQSAQRLSPGVDERLGAIRTERRMGSVGGSGRASGRGRFDQAA